MGVLRETLEAAADLSSAAFAGALARLFAGAGRPVPTERQAAGVAAALAERGLRRDAFAAWCGADRGRVGRARGPGILASWAAEYAAYASAQAALAAEAGAPCGICGRPIAGAAIGGCHFECAGVSPVAEGNT
jgi:hypothetical protein